MMEKLLILDDEALILTSLKHLFENDYETFQTTDAEAALRLAEEHDLAVILCDERMPGISGHEFLRRVKEFSRATRVVMSGYADMSALTDAVNGGQIFAYIAKPWEPLTLKAQVSAAVAHFKLVQEVEHERELLRALMENIPDPIYFKERESRFTGVNRAHARNLGINDSGECIGKSDADYFKSEDALRWRLQEEEIVRTGRPQLDQIERLSNARGELRWFSTTKVPMFDRSGRVSGIAGIARDFTALKNGEEMLREQNARYRLILDTAHDAFIGMDPDGSITAWNPQAELTFGWLAEEVMGSRWSDVAIAPAYREAHAHGVEHFLAASRGPLMRRAMSNRTLELVALHRDGHEFPVEATVWPVRFGEGYSFNAFVRDIRERRNAEKEREKEAALVQLLQSVAVAANESSTIEQTAQVCLDRVCAYTGWPVGHAYLRVDHSAEEPLSARVWHMWHLEDEGRYSAFRAVSERSSFVPGTGLPGCVLASQKPQWITSLAEEEIWSERTRAAGQAGLLSAFAFPVLVEEKIRGVLEFFSPQIAPPDQEFLTIMGHIGSQLGQVILRQRAEEDLKSAKASAESANLAKSDFLTTMSHEMRTPMNAILGMADLLSESPLREDQRDYVQIFQRAGANLLHLINDILDLSKVESGRVELESIRFDLSALLDKTIEIMAIRARDRGLRLTLEILPGVPTTLLGDPYRLRQILLNLVGNALKFTEQGSVTLRVEPAPAMAKEKGMKEECGEAWLRFSVIDTGIGIAPGKTEMIFGHFTQADSSTTRKYGGSGLGLAISKSLAELMGGHMDCTSEIGKGSTFFLTAPFEVYKETEASGLTGAPAAATSPAEPSAQRPGFRILIAEDSEDNLALIKAYLKDCGFELDFAENGKVAVDKAISGRPNLVLMDLQMPVMDGLEATSVIRQWEMETNAPAMPILALTAHAVAAGAGKSLMAGCTGHLTKPIRKATLLEAIARHVDQKIRITPPQGIEALVPNYLANVRRDILSILATGTSKDWTVAQRLGHQLKGSGEGYGFAEITRTGAAIEQAAAAANEDEIRSQILALSGYLDRVEIVV
jgi:PAS domain S-box-containing protein